MRLICLARSGIFIHAYPRVMAPRKLHQQPLYLEPVDAEDLDRLAGETGLPKQRLLREAVADLFVEYRAKGFPRSKTPSESEHLDLDRLRREVAHEIRAEASIDIEALIETGELEPTSPRGWYIVKDLEVLSKVSQLVGGLEDRTVKGEGQIRVRLSSSKKYKELDARLRIDY